MSTADKIGIDRTGLPTSPFPANAIRANRPPMTVRPARTPPVAPLLNLHSRVFDPEPVVDLAADRATGRRRLSVRA